MGTISRLKTALGRDTSAPRSGSDICPWCGERVKDRYDRVVIDGREYHGACAVARMDAGVLPAEGGTHPRPDR